MESLDREARTAAKFILLKEAGITSRDLVSGDWEMREEGPFGNTTLSLWNKVGEHHVVIESMVRVRE